jgi:hypothetical protein
MGWRDVTESKRVCIQRIHRPYPCYFFFTINTGYSYHVPIIILVMNNYSRKQRLSYSFLRMIHGVTNLVQIVTLHANTANVYHSYTSRQIYTVKSQGQGIKFDASNVHTKELKEIKTEQSTL